MASQFFGYDPYDPYGYYYTAAPFPYNYDRYYQRQPAATKPEPKATKTRETKTSFSIPVYGPDSDREPQLELKQKAPRAREKPVEPELKQVPGARAKPVAPAMLSEEAIVRMQAAARGFLARKSVRAVHEVQREAEQVRVKMVSDAVALLADSRARVAVGEALMRMLLRLDAVRGARDYRKRVIKQVLALQDAVDALETNLATAPAPVGEEAEADAPGATTLEMVEESAVEPELLDDMQYGNETASIKTAVGTPTQVEVDEGIAGGEPEAEAGEEDANVDVDEPEGSEAEGEQEMVTEEENEHTVPMAATSDDQEPPREEPVCPLETTTTASADAASDALDVRKVMEMVTALYELSAKQGAVIGALAERVDALERTVRRMEDALNTEGK